MEQAARRFGVSAGGLVVRDGVIQVRDDAGLQVSYGELVQQGARSTSRISDSAPVKRSADYTVVGTPVPRIDIPAKVTGGLIYVHDMRVPGMLHARVVRPPYAGVWRRGAPIRQSLVSIDEARLMASRACVRLVVIKDFIEIVAEREEDAIKAVRRFR